MLERVVSRGHEFTIHPWPLWVSMVAIAFGAVALLLYSLPQAGGRRAPQMGCMPLLIVILVGSLFVGMPMLAWVKVGGPYGGSAEIHSYRVFRPFLERATWFSVLGASLFLLGLMVQRSRKVQGRPAKLALLSGAFALLAGAGVMAYTTWFVALDCLPRFEREGHGFLHVGRERAVRTLVSCGEGWPTPPVQHLTAIRQFRWRSRTTPRCDRAAPQSRQSLDPRAPHPPRRCVWLGLLVQSPAPSRGTHAD